MGEHGKPDAGKPPAAPFAYERRPPKPRPAWAKLPLENGDQRCFLPNFCCQCMAGGNTRIFHPLSLTAGVTVFLCPPCRTAWQRRARQVFWSCALGIVLSVAAGTLFVTSWSARPLDWTLFAATVLGLTGIACLLSLPVLHCLSSPLLIGWGGQYDKTVWVRFPNRDYVALIAKY
jgi:hypothetical protein